MKRENQLVSWGTVAFAFGALAFLPSLFDRELLILSWLGSMQVPVGLSAMIVGGVLLAQTVPSAAPPTRSAPPPAFVAAPAPSSQGPPAATPLPAPPAPPVASGLARATRFGDRRLSRLPRRCGTCRSAGPRPGRRAAVPRQADPG